MNKANAQAPQIEEEQEVGLADHEDIGGYEVLDRLSVISDNFERFVASHQETQAHDGWREAAEEIGHKLHEFYRLVANDVL